MRERRQFRWPERTGVTTWLRKRRRLRSRSRCKLPRTFVSGTFLLIVTCTEPSDRGSGPTFAVTDSAGITIAVSAAVLARGQSELQVDSVADLEIGREDDPYYQFDRIRGVMQSRDGQIVVLNAGTSEIRLYDATGQYITARGGKGRGPGEYESPQLIPSLSRDTLLLFDSRLQRFTETTLHGGSVRTIPRRRNFGTPVGAAGNKILVLHPTLSFPTDPGVYDRPAGYSVVDLQTGREDTLGVFTGRKVLSTIIFGESTMLNVPFDAVPSAAAGPSTFYITVGEGPEIIEFHAAAHPARIIRVREPIRTVSKQVFDSVAAARASAMGTTPDADAVFRDVYMQMPLPEIMPAFQSLLVDDLGWLWAELYRPVETDQPEWMVFDPEGRAHGILRTPKGLRIYHIGRDFVLGSWRDELDVDHVRRHRLRRGVTP